MEICDEVTLSYHHTNCQFIICKNDWAVTVQVFDTVAAILTPADSLS